MAHKMYTTDAIVCGSRNNNTADRSYLLFTRDAGMLWATARSVREERSKQRFALQDFSFIRVSLVKGKGGWRVGSVETTGNVFMQASSREARAGLSSIINLVRRFLQGEESHPDVFKDTEMALAHVADTDTPSNYLVEHYSLRLLAQLGYIAPHSDYNELLESADWLNNVLPLPKRAEEAINQGLRVSHL